MQEMAEEEERQRKRDEMDGALKSVVLWHQTIRIIYLVELKTNRLRSYFYENWP